MKKTISLLAALIMILSIGLTQANAENKPGDTVTISFSLNNPNEANTIYFAPDYEKSVFSYAGASGSNGFTAPQKEGRQFAYSSENPAPSGVIGSINLTIKPDAAPGTYSIGASSITAEDFDENSVSVTISGGSVTVVVPEDEKKDDETTTDPADEKKDDEYELVECGHGKTLEKVTKEATCTAAGEKQTVCEWCGEVIKTEEIPALGHDDGKWEETKAATCTEEGSKTLKCTRCGETLKTEAIPALGHDDGKWVVVTPATSETEGLRQLQCTRCGEVLGEEVLPVVTSEWLSVSVCSLGFRYRDVKPELTDKWYMFTPLDLSQNGETVFDLIGGNCTKVGRVTVNVNDGKATVSYFVFGGVDVADMGFALLPNLDSVTDVDAIDYSRFAFDEEISIADALAGDTHVLLQVMGRVTYDFMDPRCPRFYCTGKDYQDFLDSRRPFMD